MAMDLYVYYRVATEHEQELQTRVTAMQSLLKTHYPVAVALKRRPEAKDGRHTWMEVYVDVPNGFETDLAAAVNTAAVAELIDGDRHIELFLDITACA